MVTQPNFTVYVSCTRRVRPQTVGGYDFRFVHITAEQEFGVMKHWIDKERFVMISDMERTIIDGLRHPAFVGGITEVAKGLWMKRDVLKVERLVDYARRLDIGAVVRRLGYLLEHYGPADAPALEPLRTMLTAPYQRLDPLPPAEGEFLRAGPPQHGRQQAVGDPDGTGEQRDETEHDEQRVDIGLYPAAQIGGRCRRCRGDGVGMLERAATPRLVVAGVLAAGGLALVIMRFGRRSLVWLGLGGVVTAIGEGRAVVHSIVSSAAFFSVFIQSRRWPCRTVWWQIRVSRQRSSA